jgi:hypothetical protein
MRILICLITILFAFSVAAAQEHGESKWQQFRSDADGFSIEMPGTPKVETRDLGKGATQKMFSVEIGEESYFASVIDLGKGNGPQNTDEAYFSVLMKAYVDGSTTTLRSSRMFTWAGHSSMEGIADAAAGTHLIDITAAGDRVYLVVFAGAKNSENEPKARRLRDSFKLLGN